MPEKGVRLNSSPSCHFPPVYGGNGLEFSRNLSDGRSVKHFLLALYTFRTKNPFWYGSFAKRYTKNDQLFPILPKNTLFNSPIYRLVRGNQGKSGSPTIVSAAKSIEPLRKNRSVFTQFSIFAVCFLSCCVDNFCCSFFAQGRPQTHANRGLCMYVCMIFYK